MRRLGVLIAVLAVFITSFIVPANATQRDERFAITLNDNGNEIMARTNANSVEEFLEGIGVELSEYDTIYPPLTNEITKDMEISILRAFTVYMRVDGSRRFASFTVRPGSFLAGVVSNYKAYTGGEYIFDRDNWHMRLNPGDVITLKSVLREQSISYEDIAYKTEYIYDDTIEEGIIEIDQEGINGQMRITEDVVRIGGYEHSRQMVSIDVAESSQPRIKRVGTMEPPNRAVAASGEVFEYNRSLVMEATAYTLSFACTGRRPGDPFFGVTASGMMARVGVVAVDTNVIPFHTRLYIEGYGFAVAGDRGGAIRGNKVDLFFDTMEEVRSFGRRNIRVWILDDIA